MGMLHEVIQQHGVDIQELQNERDAQLKTKLDWETRTLISRGEGLIYTFLNWLLTYYPLPSLE